ncbi:hypothetical protein [Kitasatospora cinereorecta]|uniref:Uncharacterized protein n=1 Tax=Kitasatospora cinereorecta TaxID=285560 RepID=A0ABW0VQY1_9ACTN
MTAPDSVPFAALLEENLASAKGGSGRLAEGLREHYFKDSGRRAAGLDVELNDIAWMDVEL